MTRRVFASVSEDTELCIKPQQFHMVGPPVPVVPKVYAAICTAAV